MLESNVRKLDHVLEERTKIRQQIILYATDKEQSESNVKK